MWQVIVFNFFLLQTTFFTCSLVFCFPSQEKSSNCLNISTVTFLLAKKTHREKKIKSDWNEGERIEEWRKERHSVTQIPMALARKEADGKDCSLRSGEEKVTRNSPAFSTRDLCQDRFILSVLNVTLFTYFQRESFARCKYWHLTMKSLMHTKRWT